MRRDTPSLTTTMSATPDQVDLLKLSREKLKQLCKERGHTGYSKCTKPQLVALLGLDTPSKFNSSVTNALQRSKQDAPLSPFVSRKRLEPVSSGLEQPIAKKKKGTNQTPSKTMLPTRYILSAPFRSEPELRLPQNLPTELVVPPIPNTPETAPFSEGQQVLPFTRPQSPEPVSRSRITPELRKFVEGTSFPVAGSSPQPSRENGRSKPSKKFQGPRKTAPNSRPAPGVPQVILPSSNVTTEQGASADKLPTLHLESPALPIPILGPIGIPPSIPDRKRVQCWSIILAGISDLERRSCILVSRTFRYAGRFIF